MRMTGVFKITTVVNGLVVDEYLVDMNMWEHHTTNVSGQMRSNDLPIQQDISVRIERAAG